MRRRSCSAQHAQRVGVPVAHALAGRHAQQVLVDARARRSAGAARPDGGRAARARPAVPRRSPAAQAPGPLQTLEMPDGERVGQRVGDGLDALEHATRRRAQRREQAQGVLGAIDERARDVAQRRGLERLGRGPEARALGLGVRRVDGQRPGDHDAAPPASMPSRRACAGDAPRCCARSRGASKRSLMQVALGQALDQLQALEPERGLRRDRVGEVARVLARAPVRRPAARPGSPSPRRPRRAARRAPSASWPRPRACRRAPR